MIDNRARRYHWLAEGVDSFVEEPQAAIPSQAAPAAPLDLTTRGSAATRDTSVDLVKGDPVHRKRELERQHSLATFGGGRAEPDSSLAPRLEALGPGERGAGSADDTLPRPHELRDADLTERALDQFQRAYESQPDDYEERVAIDGIGPGSLRALALIAELVYDAESSRTDPAKYAYAPGGKDGTPHPVDRERDDRSIEYVRSMVDGSEIERETKQAALERQTTIE